jgi:UDP-glucose 4-epimerase
VTIGFAGGRGMIGSELIRHFAKSCIPMRAIVRPPADESGISCVSITPGDLCLLRDCEAFLSGVDTIFYLAHTNTPIDSDQNWLSDVELNLSPLLTLIHAIRTMGHCPHIVYFSSGGAVYGRNAARVPFLESDPCRPESSYGVQKMTGEHYLRVAALKGILKATVLRVSNAYGTLLPSDKKQGFIGVTVRRLLSGKPAKVFGSPDNIRDYIHLDDICAISEAVLQPKKDFNLYNAGTGQGHSVRQVLSMIQESAEIYTPPDFISSVDANSLTDWTVLDISKAKRELNWSPQVELRAGIAKLVQQAREAL